MLSEKYNTLMAKLEGLEDKHEITCNFDTDSYNISLTVRPNTTTQAQLSLIKEEKEKPSVDAKIVFVFEDGEMIVKTYGKMFLKDSLFNKLKNCAKNLHYVYLQMLRQESFEGENETPEEDEPDTVEYDSEDDEEEDF